MTWDIVALIGLTLATFGLYCIYPPLATIAVGAVLVWIGIRGYRRGQKHDTQ